MEEVYHIHKQPRSPQETASWLSRLFFVWLHPLFRAGLSRALTVDDLYACPQWEESQPATDRLQEEWEKELSTGKPKLFRALWRIYGKIYLAVAILVVIEECVKNVLQPVALGWLVSYLTNLDSPWMSYTEFVLCAALVSFLGGAHIFTHHPYFFNMQRIGMRVRVACCSLMYRKCLKLSQAALNKTASGQMVNLMSNDVRYFDSSVLFIPYLIVAPLQTLIITVILYKELGWPSLCGVGYVLVWVPFQYGMGSKFAKIRLQTAELTDRRVRLTNELVAAMRVVKMYAWEKPFGKLVAEVRKLEIGRVRIASRLKGINMALYFVSSKFVLFLSFTCYTVITGGRLTSEKVFVSMALFNSLRLAMGLYFPFGVTQGMETMVSIGRIQSFLALDEKPPEHDRTISRQNDDLMLRLSDVKATWSELGPLVLNNVNFRIRRGELIIIVGPVGCGKTSLLMSILGELPLQAGCAKLGGTVAYAAQVPWLFQATLKRNVCFNSELNEKRFRKVVEVCALERDISLLPLGENTLVEDKGVSLSGGQKARVSLARAVYHDADLYLLDDPLSAVDSAVSKHIFDKCIRGYLRHKAVIVCTHQLQYLKFADRVLVLEPGGKPAAYGRYQDIVNSGVDVGALVDSFGKPPAPTAPGDVFSMSLKRRSSSAASTIPISEVRQDCQDAPEISAGIREQHTEEGRETGTVSGKVYWQFVKLGSGWFLLSLLVISSIASQALFNGSDFWLTYWADRVEEKLREDGGDLEPRILSRMAWVYALLVFLLLVVSLIRALTFFVMCMRTSIELHDGMFASICRSPIAFFDQNPIGRIQNRFTKDIGVIDDILPPTGLDISFIMLNLAGVLVSVAVVCPYVIVPTILLIALFGVLWRIYICTARDVKRLEGVTRSPVFSQVSSSLNGLATIRAYGVEAIFERLFDLHQDRHTSAWNLFLCTSRWFGITLDFLAFAYIAIVTMSFSFMGAHGVFGLTGGEVGLAIANALLLTGMFQWGVRQAAEIESQMTSVERVLEYRRLEPEAPLESEPEHRPPPDWPQSGALSFRDVSLRYKPGQQPVLHGISWSLLPREKVGVVGRTGAGKSSIITALFRLHEFEGDIVIDGISIKNLGLHDLRSAVAIIPQEPALFEGTVRRNLDPFGQRSDEELWQALDEAKLKDTINALPGGLSTIITEEGSNLSVGQRQLMCLARAIVRRNKLLVLDEATANVDPHTDSLIQETIRRSFTNCTVLTVAHRLNTVMDSDRIIVLDAGRVVEFDTPHALLSDPRSRLTQMVDLTGPASAEQLREIAREAYFQANDTIPL